MADELEQLDEIVESDILDALGENPSNEVQEEEIKIEDLEESTPKETSLKEEDEITIEDFEEEAQNQNDQDKVLEEDSKTDEASLETPPESDILETEETLPSTKEHIVEMESSSIVSLLNELLQNKTLEITIKIKD